MWRVRQEDIAIFDLNLKTKFQYPDNPKEHWLGRRMAKKQAWKLGKLKRLPALPSPSQTEQFDTLPYGNSLALLPTTAGWER